MESIKILVVEDETDLEFLINLKFRQRIQTEEWQFLFAGNGLEALTILKNYPDIAVVLSDIKMPRMDGLTLLTHLRKDYPLLCTIIITAYDDMKNIRTAMNLGAYDFLTKPINFPDLEITLEKAIRHITEILQHVTERKIREKKRQQEEERLRRENLTLKGIITTYDGFGELVGRSPAMQKVYKLIVKIAATNMPVLISGETGTGKELIARTIHQMSDRADHKFIPVNCGAIAEPLFEREMFGHRKGSFTGAHADIPGVFAMAHQGTIFLDEVGDLPFAMQVKLLRVLTDGEHKPVGSPNSHYSDVRVIAATNRKLEDLVEQGHFREDLFYRLLVLSITVPPLRERCEDIPLLIEHFLKLYGQDENQQTLPKDILWQLIAYDWPGNVRELHNVVHQYMVTQSLNFAGKRSAQSVEAGIEILQEPRPLHEATKEFEKHFIIQVLVSHQWNREEAAATLGISARTLRRKIQEYQIIKPYKRFPIDS